MVKKILIVLLGIVCGSVLIYAVEAIGHLVYPPPEQMDLNDIEAMKAMIKTLPIGALLFVLLAYAVGSFGGGFIVTLFSKSRKPLLAIVVGVVLAIFGIINLFMIPHPVWFAVASILLYVPCAYMGSLIAKRVTK